MKAKSTFLARSAMLLLFVVMTTVSARADFSGKCGTNLYYYYHSFTQTLEFYIGTDSSTGSMTNYEINGNYAVPWIDERANITKVIIGEGVTSIGNYAFYGCTALTNVTISNTVTDIGNNAFTFSI